MRKLKKGDIVMIEWLDACTEMDTPYKKLEMKKPVELLMKTKSYGAFFRQDNKALILIAHATQWDCDYISIPLRWITKIKLLKKANEKEQDFTSNQNNNRAR